MQVFTRTGHPDPEGITITDNEIRIYCKTVMDAPGFERKYPEHKDQVRKLMIEQLRIARVIHNFNGSYLLQEGPFQFTVTENKLCAIVHEPRAGGSYGRAQRHT